MNAHSPCVGDLVQDRIGDVCARNPGARHKVRRQLDAVARDDFKTLPDQFVAENAQSAGPLTAVEAESPLVPLPVLLHEIQGQLFCFTEVE